MSEEGEIHAKLLRAWRETDVLQDPNGALAAIHAAADLVADLAQPRIKPLVWEVFDYATAWAKSPFGTYRLNGVLLSLSTQKKYIHDGLGNYTFNTIEAAKAAAQADYEARILAALTTPPDPRIAAAEKLADILEAAINEHDTANYEWGEENPWTMGEWFSDEDRAALAAYRKAGEVKL